MCYNNSMSNKNDSGTRTTEMVTISRAEYEDLKAQNQWLMEQLRLIRKKQFGYTSEKASEYMLLRSRNRRKKMLLLWRFALTPGRSPAV